MNKFSKQNAADYLESYDARFRMPSEKPRDHDYSPDEDELEAVSNEELNLVRKTMSWGEQKLHWFKVK